MLIDPKNIDQVTIKRHEKKAYEKGTLKSHIILQTVLTIRLANEYRFSEAARPLLIYPA